MWLTCINQIISVLFIQTYFEKTTFILTTQDDKEEEILSSFMNNFSVNIYITRSGDEHLQRGTTANYIVYVSDIEDVKKALLFIKTDALDVEQFEMRYFIILNQNVKFNESFMERCINLLLVEDVNGIILSNNISSLNQITIVKKSQCTLSQCTWNKILQLDKCLSNSTLIKVITNDPKKEVHAVVRAYPPNFIKVPKHSRIYEHNQNHGVEYNILAVLARKLNITIYYTSFDMDNSIGNVFKNGSVTGLLKYIDMQNYDLFVGSLSLTYERILKFYKSYPYIYSKITWCTPHYSNETNLKTLLRLMDIYTIGLLVLIFFCVVIIKYNSEKTSFTTIVLETYACLLGVPTHLSNDDFLRLITGLVILMNIFLTGILLTSLTSLLCNIQHVEEYGTYKDIEDSNLKLYTDESLLYLFIDISIFHRLNICRSFYKCLNEVMDVTAAYAVETINPIHLMSMYRTKDNEPRIYCFNEPIVYQQNTMYFRNGFQYLTQFIQIVFRLNESGLVSKFIQDVSMTPLNHENTKKTVILEMKELIPIYYFIGIMYTFSFLVFVVEVLSQFKRRKIVSTKPQQPTFVL